MSGCRGHIWQVTVAKVQAPSLWLTTKASINVLSEFRRETRRTCFEESEGCPKPSLATDSAIATAGRFLQSMLATARYLYEPC